VDEKGCIVSCDIFAELHRYVEYVRAVGLQRLKTTNTMVKTLGWTRRI